MLLQDVTVLAEHAVVQPSYNNYSLSPEWQGLAGHHHSATLPTSTPGFAYAEALSPDTAVDCRIREAGRISEASAQDGGAHACQDGRQSILVMLPLDTVNSDGVFRYATAPWFSQALQLLAASGTQGVAVDVWWGAVERSPGEYNWAGYKQLFEMVRAAGLRVQAVLSFHACGGNVGDHVQIPLPPWVLAAGQQDPDIFFTDQPRNNGLGQRNKEYLSIWADEEPCLFGRSPMSCYMQFMEAFRSAFTQDLGGLISEVVVGMGPCGELRYPGYPEAQGWRFPGIGEFQCYDRRALASLAQAAREAGRPDWGFAGPHDAGSYNSSPDDTGFFNTLHGNWDSEYGHFFMGWYSSCLLGHGERLLAAATRIFGPYQRPGSDGLREQLGRLIRQLKSMLTPPSTQPPSPMGSSSGQDSPATVGDVSFAVVGNSLREAPAGPAEQAAPAGVSLATTAAGGDGLLAAGAVAETKGAPAEARQQQGGLTPFEALAQLLQMPSNSPLQYAGDLASTLLSMTQSSSISTQSSLDHSGSSGGGGVLATGSAGGGSADMPLGGSASVGSLASLCEQTAANVSSFGRALASPVGQRLRSTRRLSNRQRWASSGMLAEAAAAAESANALLWAPLSGNVSLGSLSSDCCVGGQWRDSSAELNLQLDDLELTSSCAAPLAPSPAATLARTSSTHSGDEYSSTSSGGGAAPVAAEANAIVTCRSCPTSPKRRGLLGTLLNGLTAAQVGVLEALAARQPAVQAGTHARGALALSMKLAGVHWWYHSRSHAGELTAGYYNTAHRDGYRPIIEMAARYNASVTLTCVEMCDAQHPPGAKCGPEALLRQVRSLAAELGVPLSGENALPIFSHEGVDMVALDRIVHNMRPWAPPPQHANGATGGGLYGGSMRRSGTVNTALASLAGGSHGGMLSGCGRTGGAGAELGGLMYGSMAGAKHTGRSNSTPVCRASSASDAGAVLGFLGGGGSGFAGGLAPDTPLSECGGAPPLLSTMASFTFLRLGPEMLQPEFQAPWVSFVSRMRQGGRR